MPPPHKHVTDMPQEVLDSYLHSHLSQESKKDMLKVAGFGWLACAATHAYNAQARMSVPNVSARGWTSCPCHGQATKDVSSRTTIPDFGREPHAMPLRVLQNNIQQRDISNATAVGQAVLGGA